jgi:hypothetical protein
MLFKSSSRLPLSMHLKPNAGMGEWNMGKGAWFVYRGDATLAHFLGSHACFAAGVNVHHVVCVGLTGPLRLNDFLTGQFALVPAPL